MTDNPPGRARSQAAAGGAASASHPVRPPQQTSFTISFPETKFYDLLAYTPGTPHPLMSGVMPIVRYGGDRVDVVGTCFALTADGLLMTARHVAIGIKEWLDVPGHDVVVAYSGEGIPAHTPEGLASVGIFLPVRGWSFNEYTDAALLHVDIPNLPEGARPQFSSIPLSINPPLLDEQCLLVGYTAKSRVADNPAQGPMVAIIDEQLNASTGTVGNVHLIQLDSSLAPFPCFEIHARNDQQMSGGPVLSSDQKTKTAVISGIVSGGFEDGISHGIAALLWPALGLPVPRADRSDDPPPSLYEMGTKGVVRIRGLDAVKTDVRSRTLTVNPDSLIFGRYGGDLFAPIGPASFRAPEVKPRAKSLEEVLGIPRKIQFLNARRD